MHCVAKYFARRLAFSSSLETVNPSAVVKLRRYFQGKLQIRNPCHGHPIEINFFLKKEERDGTGSIFPLLSGMDRVSIFP